jgi:hypothetical protein
MTAIRTEGFFRILLELLPCALTEELDAEPTRR